MCGHTQGGMRQCLSNAHQGTFLSCLIAMCAVLMSQAGLLAYACASPTSHTAQLSAVSAGPRWAANWGWAAAALRPLPPCYRSTKVCRLWPLSQLQHKIRPFTQNNGFGRRLSILSLPFMAPWPLTWPSCCPTCCWHSLHHMARRSYRGSQEQRTGVGQEGESWLPCMCSESFSLSFRV